MSNQDNNRGCGHYGLLNAVPNRGCSCRCNCGGNSGTGSVERVRCAELSACHPRCRHLYYDGPCPRAVTRPGICIDPCRRCNIPWERGDRCAPICCDRDCMVELTKEANRNRCDCRCECHCHCGGRPRPFAEEAEYVQEFEPQAAESAEQYEEYVEGEGDRA